MGTGVAVGGGTAVDVAVGTGVGGGEVAGRTGVAVAAGAAVAVGALMGGAAVAVAGFPGSGSGSLVRTSGVDGGLAGNDDAFCVGAGSDGAVEVTGCSESLPNASDHQPSPRVPGPDRTWTTPFRSTPTFEDWEVML